MLGNDKKATSRELMRLTARAGIAKMAPTKRRRTASGNILPVVPE
jgi:hypothetical protein